MQSLKRIDANELIKKRKRCRDLEKEIMVTSGKEQGEGEWDLAMNMYPLLNLKWIISKALLYSPGSSVQWSVAACMGGECEGEGYVHVYG